MEKKMGPLKKNKVIRIQGTLFTSFMLFLIVAIGCSDNGPPQEILESARERTVAIIDSVRTSRDMVKSEPELLKESYDPRLQRYSLAYYVETEYGSALTDSPTAYLYKEGNNWKYQFQFGGMFEFIYEK
jgi:hypothetical protein